MGNLFDGLESMGFSGLGNVKLFEEEKKELERETATSAPKVPVATEEDFIFDKKVKCPVCDSDFTTKTVKAGKPRLVGSDSDLRPKYAIIDSVKYDAVVCPMCGYGALTRFFSNVSTQQGKLIKINVSPQFKGLPKSGSTYTYEEAIARFKLALLNSVVKKSKNSEKAYTCLKLGWLFRGMKENTDASVPNAEALRKKYEAEEKEMIVNAYQGFVQARQKEDFPICGMDEATLDYLVADLAFRCDDLANSEKYAQQVILSRSAKTALKEKARDLRDEVKKRKSEE